MGKRNRKRVKETEVNPLGIMIPEIPVDPAEYLGYGEPTYGGKPMPDFLPTYEEYMAAFRKRNGLPPL